MNKDIKRIDTLDKNGIDLLKKLKDQTVRKMFVDFCFCDLQASEPDYERIGHIFFETDENDRLFYLKNVFADEPADKDQYCSFKICECEKDKLNMKHQFMKLDENKKPVVDRITDYKWHITEIGGKIESVQIYRDNATWSYDGVNWDITADVAIKIVGNNFKYLFVLQDTLFSFVSVFLNYDENDDELINKYWKATKWGCKSENLPSLKRQCIEL